MQHQTKQLGGKGSVRRKVKRHTQPGQNQAKQIQEIMKKINANEIQKQGTVNLFKSNGKVLSSDNTTVHYSQNGHIFSLTGGQWKEKNESELQADMFDGMNPENIAALQKMAESYQQTSQMKKDVENVPELVEDAELD